MATVRILEQEKLVERAHEMGRILGDKLKIALASHRNVADIRGMGMMWGVELVKDKQTLEPFPRKERVTERLWDDLFRNGVILYKSVGLAGTDGDALVIGPPFVINEAEVDLLVTGLAESIHAILK
jgi:adenosylmethionine-8-amino-7-oxononanoate aminotransferase